MSKRRRAPVQQYHDRVAARYDLSYDDEYWQWHDALTWDYLKPFLPRDLSVEVVDLGCGTGKWGAKLIESGFRVTSVDISHQMLDEARKKMASESARARAHFVQADLCDLAALPAGGFVFAIALGDPIGCTESPARAMKQIRRILAPGGVLVATFDNKLAAIDYYLDRGDANELQHFLRDGKTHWLTKDVAERFPIVTFSPAEVRRLVESAGFEVIDTVGKTVLPMRRHRELLSTPQVRRMWAKVEKKLSHDHDAIGRASHLQVACRVVAD